ELLPEVPTLDIDAPSPEVVLTAAVVVALVVIAGLCIAATAGICAGGLGGAAAASGSATLGAVVAAGIAALLGLFGLNLWGDPHLATPDGFAYDLQTVGEFHLLEIPDDHIDVQAR